MADARVYWVAISRNGQFPVSPHTYKWLEKNTGVETGYCSLGEMKPSEWRIDTQGAKLWKAEGWLATTNDTEAAAIVLRNFLKSLPNDRQLILIFTMDADFTFDPICYPLVLRSLYIASVTVDASVFQSLLPVEETTSGAQEFVGKQFNLSGRGGLTTEMARATMAAKLLPKGYIITYVRNAFRITGPRSYGIPTNT